MISHDQIPMPSDEFSVSVEFPGNESLRNASKPSTKSEKSVV